MASITDQTKWRRVLNHVAADLKAVIDIAAGQSVEVTQGTAANLKAEVTLAALSEIIVKQATATNLKALATLSSYRGILPNPATATRVQDYSGVSGVSTVEVYEVDAGETLFLDNIWLSSRLSADASAQCYVGVRDPDDDLQVIVLHHYYDKAGHQIQVNPYPVAFEIGALWDIIIVGTHANVDGVFGYSGWREAV